MLLTKEKERSPFWWCSLLQFIRPVQMTSLRSAGQFSKVASHLMRGGTCRRAGSRRVLSVKTHLAVPSAAGPTQKTTRDVLIPRMKSLESLAPQAHICRFPRKRSKQKILPLVCPFPVLWLLIVFTEICCVQSIRKPLANLIIEILDK